MIVLIKVICIVLAIAIIALVLLQQGKGSDLGSAFGGGSSNSMFGYFGFLVAIGIYERRFSGLAIASLTLFYYGGLIFGVLPTNSFVSWEGHLFGLLAGILAARVFARTKVSDRTT